MTNQNIKQSSIEESTISRQTRNAFAAAVIFAIAALINFIISLQISLSIKTTISFIDTISTFIFILLTVASATLVRKGEKEKGTWLLLISFVSALALRNALIADLSVIFSVLAASLVPIVGLLTLKPKVFVRSLSLGIFSASFYLVFDILASRFFPAYRQQLDNIASLTITMSVIALIIISIFVVSLFRQQHFLLLSSKLTLAMVVVVLVPIITLSIAGVISLKNSLIPRQTEEMRIKASFVAQNIDRFISENKNSLRSNGENPAIVQYLLALQDAQAEEIFDLPLLENQALESLRSFRRKDILQISSYAILDTSGINILDTAVNSIGNDESEADYFIQPSETNLSFVSDIIRTGNNNYSLYFSAPIYVTTLDKEAGFVNEQIGVIRAEYALSTLQQFISDYVQTEGTNQENIFATLITEKEVKQIDPEDPKSVFLVLSNSKNPDLNLLSITPLTTNVITPLQMARILPVGSTAQLSLDVPGFDEGLRNRSETPAFEAQAFPRESGQTTPLDVIATAEIEEISLPWTVIISQDISTFNAPFRQQSDTRTLLSIVIAISAAAIAYAGSQYLIQPILQFADIANKVAQGDLSARVDVTSEDEIGAMGIAFNSMTAQLDTLFTTLEDRVNERTQALERSAQQLHAAVAVGSAAASLRDLDELLSQATELISKQFGFYHAGIFLIDTYGKHAELRAANSKGGRKMLARAHKLAVGAEGIVGYVTQEGEARIALDVGQDAAYFDNPDLPQTRSEMALPLIAGGKILGALDIQSTEGEAFKEADTITLQVLADQIAVSIENAALFEESRKALATVQRAYGEQSQLGWQELIHQETNYGYRSGSDGNIYPVQEEADSLLTQTMQENQTQLDKDELTANIPILVRGETVGAIQLSKPDNTSSWNQKDLDLAQTLTTELSRAMDSARLFDETKQQADRERVVGEISNRMRETMNVESVVRLAADELYKLLNLEHITIHLSPDGTEDREEIA